MPVQVLLHKPLSTDLYRIRMSWKREMVNRYEAVSRQNSGAKNGGCVNHCNMSDLFMDHVLQLVWAKLDHIMSTSPDMYEAIVKGTYGNSIPVNINMTGFLKLKKITETQKYEFEYSSAIDRKGNGMAVRFDNMLRNLRKIRTKLTAGNTIQHANGKTSESMDFFTHWTRVNAAGKEDVEGRKGHIGYVNLKWVLGPEWKAPTGSDENREKSGEKNQELVPDKKNYPESDSTKNIEVNNLNNKKKKEESGIFENSAAELQPTQTQKFSGIDLSAAAKPQPQKKTYPGQADQQSVKATPPVYQKQTQKSLADQQSVKAALQEPVFKKNPTVFGNFLVEFASKMNYNRLLNENPEDQPPRIPAAPPSSRYKAAFELWTMLYEGIYLPLIGQGRVRYCADKIYISATFPNPIQHKAIAQIEELLKTYSGAVLKKAIEKQAEWLKNDGTRWIYTPGTYLNASLASGTLVSAIRELVRPDQPQYRTEMPKDELPADQRVDILYQKIIDLGCKDIRKYTFLNWSRRYGIDYLCRIFRLFRDEMHRQRLSGKKVGEEFKQGASKKLAQMVYYGQERITEFISTEAASLKKRLIRESNTDRWAKSIAKVKALDNDEITALNRLSFQYLGVRVEKFADVDQNEKAVFLAWAYEVFWFHRASNSAIKN